MPRKKDSARNNGLLSTVDTSIASGAIDPQKWGEEFEALGRKEPTVPEWPLERNARLAREGVVTPAASGQG